MNGLETEIAERRVKGVEGATKQIIKLEDAVMTKRDLAINKQDDMFKAERRLAQLRSNHVAIIGRIVYGEEEREAQNEKIENSLKAISAAEQDYTTALQQSAHAQREHTRTDYERNEQITAHRKNLRDVAKITTKNTAAFKRQSLVTNKMRREAENLHAANITLVQDNKKVTKSMRDLSDATQRTREEEEKYAELRKQDGVTGKQLKAQGKAVLKAKEKELRLAAAANETLVETIQHRRDHIDVVNSNEVALRRLANQSLQLGNRMERIGSLNSDAIDQNRSLTRQFDRVSDSAEKVSREYRKYHDMQQDASVSSDALAVQIERINDALETQRRVAKDSEAALEDYYTAQDEAAKRADRQARAQEERDRRRLMPQSMGQYFARNLGALTPLGTLSPSALLPIAAVIGTVGEAVVTASQAISLLPAVSYAAAAGIGTLVMGFKGFGDALTGMGDPKKFAEALYQLSPNAQQAAVQIKALVDGPLGDLKRATQEALFVDVGGTIQRLTSVFGPAITSMTTSIATSFNQLFRGISFDMMTPVNQARIGTITDNIAKMFDQMNPAIRAFNSAFVKLAETGSGFLPQLADSLTRAMVAFDEFLAKAQEDGSLANFMSKGIDAIKAISKWLLGFGQDIYKVFGNKSPEEFADMLNTVKEVAIGLFGVFEGIAAAADTLAPIIKQITDSYGGWEKVMYGIITGGTLIGLGKFIKWGREAATVFGLVGPKAVAAAQGMGALNTAAAVTAGGAATTAAAKQTAATTAATFAAGGTAAGKGFGAKLIGGLKGMGWLAVGTLIAKPILDGLDREFNEWAASKSDNPERSLDEYNRRSERNIFPVWFPILPFWESLIRDKLGFGGELPPSSLPDAPGGVGNSAGSPPKKPERSWEQILEDLLKTPEAPDLSLPDLSLIDPETKKYLTDSEILNKYRGELPRESYAVDPYTDPITGQKLKPMLPIGPNGMPEYPAGGVPGTPSIKGPTMPQYNEFGQFTGYGANMVDPEEVFDAELAVIEGATELEEANKDLLAAQKAGILSAEEINDLERKVYQAKLGLHKDLVRLGKAQTGDIEKLRTSTSNALSDFGAEIDKDFGISKGLSGIAENITKFLANLAFAPAFGAIRGAQAGMGLPNGEGVGYGLAGIAASSMGYYKGGPMDTGQGGVAPGGPLAAEAGYTPPGFGVQTAGVGYGSGPGAKVEQSDLKGINLATIPVAAQQYANNCINAAAQIILSADGVSLTQDALDNVIKRGGSINSLASGLNKINPSGGYVALEGSGGSPEALFEAVKNSVDRGVGSVLNVAPASAGGGSIAGRSYAPGHFIAVTGYDPRTGKINLSDTGDGSMYSVTAAEAFRSSRGRGLVMGTGIAGASSPNVQGPSAARSGPVYGPQLPKYATGGEVPIMAHSGEHVLTREDVAALGGQAGVYSFRQGLHSYQFGGAVPRAPFSPDPFDPSNVPDPFAGKTKPSSGPFSENPFHPSNVPDPFGGKGPYAPYDPDAKPADLGDLLGAGDMSPAALPPALVPPSQRLPTLPETALPGGVESPGTVIGAEVEAPEGYGGGFEITGGGLLGAGQGAAMAAAGLGGGGPAAAAALETAMKLINRGIEYGGQVAAISAQGMLETFLPAGGSELAQNNWATRLLGGIAGAAPAIANLAGGNQASNQSMLPGVGGPLTAEQIAAQNMNSTQDQAAAPAGAYTTNGIGNVQNLYMTGTEAALGQDLVRYLPAPGAR